MLYKQRSFISANVLIFVKSTWIFIYIFLFLTSGTFTYSQKKNNVYSWLIGYWMLIFLKEIIFTYKFAFVSNKLLKKNDCKHNLINKQFEQTFINLKVRHSLTMRVKSKQTEVYMLQYLRIFPVDNRTLEHKISQSQTVICINSFAKQKGEQWVQCPVLSSPSPEHVVGVYFFLESNDQQVSWSLG